MPSIAATTPFKFFHKRAEQIAGINKQMNLLTLPSEAQQAAQELEQLANQLGGGGGGGLGI